MDATLRGLPEAGRALDAVAKSADDGGVEAMRLALLEIAKEWGARVPVHEGHYKAAMAQDNAVKAKPGRRGAVGYVNVPHVKGVKTRQQPKLYAARLEFGGKGIGPQPSARPGLDAAKPRLGDIVGKAVAGSVRTKGGRR